MKFLLLISCCVLAYTYSVKAQGNRVGLVKDNADRCLDVWNYDTTNGNVIGAHECHGSSNQQWQILGSDFTFRSLSKCMTVGGPGNVFIYDCNGNGTQQWIYTNNGEIYNLQFSTCLESIPKANPEVATLRTDTCTGLLNQRWVLP